MVVITGMRSAVGKDAGGLSSSTIGRLKDAWSDEHLRWSRRDLSAKRYVYFWVDGIHVQARLEDEAQCLLVIIGATPEGKKELVGLHRRRARERPIWRELLLDLKRRGLAIAPELAVADGALVLLLCGRITGAAASRYSAARSERRSAMNYELPNARCN